MNNLLFQLESLYDNENDDDATMCWCRVAQHSVSLRGGSGAVPLCTSICPKILKKQQVVWAQVNGGSKYDSLKGAKNDQVSRTLVRASLRRVWSGRNQARRTWKSVENVVAS